ncbi:MAG: VanZ family protein [Planctomycetales bacterium]|nr:VanZ family protein [Planctomycetales bacterium]
MSASSNPTNAIASTALRGEWQKPSTSRVLRKVARIASFCLAIYWLAIFTGTHLPGSTMPAVTVSDKLLHALAYTGLSFLLAWALPSMGKSLTHVTWAAGIALAYSCLDELTQMFVPSRSCDIYDIAADGVGIAVGLTSYLILRQLLLQVAWGRRLLHGLSR